MKKLFLGIFYIILPSVICAQQTEKVWHVTILNPGFEFEQPVSAYSTLSVQLGIGYSGAYPKLSETKFDSGLLYTIAPFVDLQFKRFYNLGKRLKDEKKIDQNSGNYISLRFRSRGKSLTDNFDRKTHYDFSVGPTWGIQRSYGRFHLLLDFGPQFYFDSDGNTGIWPLMPQINLGFNLN